MIAEFNPIMQENICRIKDDEIHNHYLGYNIQNELIHLLPSEIKKIIKKLGMQNIIQSYLIAPQILQCITVCGYFINSNTS